MNFSGHLKETEYFEEKQIATITEDLHDDLGSVRADAEGTGEVTAKADRYDSDAEFHG
jgi:hypothetical protein